MKIESGRNELHFSSLLLKLSLTFVLHILFFISAIGQNALQDILDGGFVRNWLISDAFPTEVDAGMWENFNRFNIEALPQKDWLTPDNGRDLVSLLTGRFKFPVVWPQPGSEWKASTGIGLGNVTLEIFHREPSAKGEAPRVARISSLALQSTDLKAALAELRARGIAHEPPPEPRPRAAGDPAPRWTTVGLEGFGHGLFLIQYAFDMDERRLRFDRVLRERNGGPLGVVRVVEVVIAPDRLDEVRVQWTKLLGPSGSRKADLRTVCDGPKIRLVRAGDQHAGDVVVEIKSLSRAAETLRRLTSGLTS